MSEKPVEQIASEHSMVVTERGEHVEIAVNGQVVYDSHSQGVLPLTDVIDRIGAALALEIREADYAFEDGSVTKDIGQAALRLAATKNVRCWFLDRAPHEDDEPGMAG